MTWAPSERFIGGQLYGNAINNAASILSEGTLKALQQYEKQKQEAEFNDATVEQLKEYVPAEQLQRYHTMSGSQKTGVAMAAIRGATFDMQKQLKNSQTDEAAARTNLLEAQAHNEWSGTGAGGANDTLNLTDDEIAAGGGTGRVPLRTSAKSFQWVEDPNNPANLGTVEPTPVKDPRDPKKIIGLQQANGVVKYFPKPTDIESLVGLGILKPPASGAGSREQGAGSGVLLPTNPEAKPDAATATLMPAVGEIRRGYKFKGGDPSNPASWEKVQ